MRSYATQTDNQRWEILELAMEVYSWENHQTKWVILHGNVKLPEGNFYVIIVSVVVDDDDGGLWHILLNWGLGTSDMTNEKVRSNGSSQTLIWFHHMGLSETSQTSAPINPLVNHNFSIKTAV